MHGDKINISFIVYPMPVSASPMRLDVNAQHYEDTPIQIYWKFYYRKNENFQIKILIFFIFLLKT